MAKKEKEPQFIMSALNTPMLNYNVYYMSTQEKILTILTAFLAGGAAGLVFYGGQFRDPDGVPTRATAVCNLIVFLVAGLIACRVYLPMRRSRLLDKRRHMLTRQFRSLLEALAVTLSSGMNMSESLISSYEDLKAEYSENSYIAQEVREMINGIQNNVPIEDMMKSLGDRSSIDDIRNFGTVFEICYRAGGNMKEIVRRTNSIIGEKIEIADEIETSLTSNKSQFSAMMVIPVVIMLMFRTMSSDFSASFSTLPGVISITIAIGLFCAAYHLGQKIMDVKG